MKHHSLVPLPGVVDRFPLPFNLLQLLVECKVFVCLGLYWVHDIVCKKLICSPLFVNVWTFGGNCWFVKCVFYFLNTWHVCMTGSLAGTGKSCFPCILCFVYWGVNHQKNTHIFHGSTMDMYGYVRISNLLDLFDVQVVRWVSTHLCRCFWCWLCKVDEIQGGGWQLEACKSFGTCQDWGPWPAIIFDYPSRSLTARPWKMMGLEDDPFLLGPGNFSGAMLNC